MLMPDEDEILPLSKHERKDNPSARQMAEEYQVAKQALYPWRMPYPEGKKLSWYQEVWTRVRIRVKRCWVNWRCRRALHRHPDLNPSNLATWKDKGPVKQPLKLTAAEKADEKEFVEAFDDHIEGADNTIWWATPDMEDKMRPIEALKKKVSSIPPQKEKNDGNT